MVVLSAALTKTLPGFAAQFTAAPASSPYLFETNFQYTNLGTFYGSSYFLSRMGVQSSTTEKSLGDAYMDTDLISQAVIQQTGQQFLSSSYTSDSQQMQALLDNAVSEASADHLTVGQALTSTQVANLTSNIVWYVTQQVDGQSVLVPTLYLANAQAINTNGATLAAGGAATLSADSLVNQQGAITAAQNLVVTTQGSIANVSGVMQAGGAVSLTSATGGITNATATVTVQVTGATGDDRTLRVGQAGIIAGGDLSVASGGNITVTGANLSAGGTLTLAAAGNVTVATNTLQQDQVYTGAHDSSQLHNTTNDSSSLTAAGGMTITAGQDVLVAGSSLSAGGNLAVNAGGNLTLAAVQNSYYSESDSKKSGGFLNSSKNHSESQTLTNQGTTLTAGGDVTLNAGSNLTAQDGNLSAGGNLSLGAAGTVSLLSATDSSYASTTSSHASSMWQSSAQKGHTDTTVQMTQMTAGGALTVTAGQGIVADYKSTGSLQTSLAALAQNPQTAWVAQLATSNPVVWQAVQEAHQSWDHESQGLSAVASAIIAIAVAVATAGAGLAGMVAEEAASVGLVTAGTDAAAAVGAAGAAGFSSLVSQASISLISNQGDLGKTLQQLGSLDTVKNLAISMASAGLTQGILSSDTFQGILPQGTDLATRLEQAALQQGVGAAVNTAADVASGKGVGSSLEKELLSAVGNAVGTVSANEIGAAYADGTLDPISHEVAHALLGCAVGAANGSCTAGAVSGALSEVVAGIVGDSLTDGGPLDDQTKAEILAAGQIAGVLGASAFGGNVQAASAAAYNAVANNYLTTKQIADFKNEMANCGAQGSAQCQGVLEKYDDEFADQAIALSVAGGTNSGVYQTLLAANDLSSTIDYLKQTNPGQTEDWYQQQAQQDIASFNESVSAGQTQVPTVLAGNLKSLGYGLLTAVAAYPAVASVGAAAEAGAAAAAADAAATKTPSALQQATNLFSSNGPGTLKIGGSTFTELPNNGNAAIFSGATDEQVQQYFMELSGASEMPAARTIPGQGTIYVVKTPQGNFTLRDFAGSSAQTGPTWTIDVPGSAVGKTYNPEIKFLR